MIYSLKGTEHQEYNTIDKVISEEIKKVYVMGDGSLWFNSGTQ